VPEGDTVWLACRQLHAALAGRVLTRCELRVPQLATTDLTGVEVREVVSRGKHQLTRFADGWTLHTHLRMDGGWRTYPTGRRWTGGPAWQIRVLLVNAGHAAVGYRLPVVELLRTDAEDSVVGHLGPDLLGPGWDPGEALRRLRADPSRSIGEALLDQRNLAGIGNLYKCETLFLLGVHPRTPVGEIDVLPQLVDKAHRLMLVNKENPEQTTTGNTRRGQRHWVYLREGQPCRRCGSLIRSETFATTRDLARAAGEISSVDSPSQARVSFWCPTCQPDPS
jgi:endonuclease-8